MSYHSIFYFWQFVYRLKYDQIFLNSVFNLYNITKQFSSTKVNLGIC